MTVDVNLEATIDGPRPPVNIVIWETLAEFTLKQTGRFQRRRQTYQKGRVLTLLASLDSQRLTSASSSSSSSAFIKKVRNPNPNPIPLRRSSSVLSMSESNHTDGDNPQPSSSAAPDPSTTPLTWPPDGELSREWIRQFTSVLSWSSRHLPPSQLPSILPSVFLQRLILTASNILHKEPNCVRVDPTQAEGEGATVVVVGDVHGQLHDVIFLLEDAGFPGEDRFFVFNGDYVDRGAWGLETFVLLLAWKIFLPHRVFLLRGNHESKYCTSVYGFEQEVMAKYGDQGQTVYRKCLRCFEGLPLASIIAGHIYTAHGGLFRGVATAPPKKRKGKKKSRKIVVEMNSAMKLGSLDELERARRTVLDPPWQGANLIPGDVLWSDPSNKPGLSPNTDRGIGLLWGPDMTEEFLYKNQFKLIIRSHEGPDARDKRDDLGGMEKGYTIDHVVTSGQLITLFSAPDYPQFQATVERYNNQGAYIVLNPPDYSTPVFRSFEAVRPRPKVKPYYNFEEVIDSDEELDLEAMDDSSSHLSNSSMDNGSSHQANSSMSD